MFKLMILGSKLFIYDRFREDEKIDGTVGTTVGGREKAQYFTQLSNTVNVSMFPTEYCSVHMCVCAEM